MKTKPNDKRDQQSENKSNQPKKKDETKREFIPKNSASNSEKKPTGTKPTKRK